MANIISFRKKPFTVGECPHDRIIVDDAKAQIECANCKILIDPIWFLSKIAHKETQYEWALVNLKKQIAEAEKKIRCKCEHCGQMTRIIK